MKRIFLFLLLSLLSITALAAEEPKKFEGLSDFMRVVKPEGRRHPRSLDTAVVRFENEKNGTTVDLVAAIHIGDKEYYEQLNELFKQYDAVLYELVADKDHKLDKKAAEEKKEKSVLSAFQSGMGESLKLDFQLEHVDYTAKNFVHADLSPAEFARRFSERGDIVLGMNKEKEDEDEELRMQGRLIGTFFVRDSSLALKRFFAREMISQMEDSTWIIGGDGSAIITDRNAAALKVLRREIRDGKKKLAIFYGGAHLPEFVKSLEKQFDMNRTGITWIVAWDLTTDRSARKAAKED